MRPSQEGFQSVQEPWKVVNMENGIYDYRNEPQGFKILRESEPLTTTAPSGWCSRWSAWTSPHDIWTNYIKNETESLSSECFVNDE